MKHLITLLITLLSSNVLIAQTQMNWFTDLEICETEDTLINFPSGEFDLYTFLWLFDGDSLTTDSSINIQNSGTYSLELYSTIDTLISSFNATVDLVENEFMLTLTDSEINVDSVVYICLEDEPTLITNQEGYAHSWYIDGNLIGADTLSDRMLAISDILDEIEYNQEYEYLVEVETSCGIYTSKNEVLMIVNECHCALNMPNVFTPNGDTQNDYFKPLNDHELETNAENICESTDFEMEIYSQWGRHIKTIRSGDNLPTWDGLNNNGNEVPAGIYYYQIDYKVNIYTVPEQKQMTGFFHLYR